MKKLKRKWKGKLKRAAAVAMAVLMVSNTIDMSAFAVSAAEEIQTVLCEHHTEHTAECGYSEGTVGSPCTHEHGEECSAKTEECVHTSHDASCGYSEAQEGSSCTHEHDEACGEEGAECTHTEHTSDCGYAEAQEGSPCTHECSEENGCIIVTENCTHTGHDDTCSYGTVSGNVACSHEHDDACGYVEAKEGTTCNYVCDLCADENKEEQPENEIATCTCETDDPAIHATNCPAYAVPENPECFCAEKCTEENINVWCDVCGVQGIEACEGEDTAAVYAFTSLTVGGVDALTTSSGTGWSYDANSSTLTISGNIGAVNATVPANSQDVLNITVTNNATVDGGIYAGGKLNLVVNSGVTLTVNSSGDNHAIASGYHGVEDSVKITGGGTVAAISSGNGDGIKSAGGLWIEGVTVAAQGCNYGLDSGSGRLYIKDNSKVYAVSSQNTAIVAPSSAGHDVVEISGENTVVVAGFALGSADNNYVPTIGTPSNSSIHAGTVKVNCGHLIVGDGFSASSFDTGSMVQVSHSNYAEYVGHLTNYQQNSNGTHTLKCVASCPVPASGTAENCSGTTYCNQTLCDKCGQTSGTGDGTSHKEGTPATCTSLAVCELCSQSYGEKDPTNHTGTAAGGYTYVDGTYHSAVFNCCNVTGGANEEHESSDSDITCDICNGLMLDKVLEEIANAPSGTTLNYSGTLGTEANPDTTSQVIMTIPEGVTVNWDVDAVVNMSHDGNIRYYPLSLSGGGTLNLTGSIKNQGSSASVTLASGSTVTLVVKDGGKVECTGGTAIVAYGGKEIRVEGGTVSGAGSYTIFVDSTSTADMMVTGGKVEATGAGYAICVAENSKSDKMIISGGEVTGNNAGIYTFGNVVVSGTPTISGTTGNTDAAIRAGNLEISGNPTISHTVGHGIVIMNNGNVIFRAGTTATVTGGNCGIYDGHVAKEVGANPTISSTAGDKYAYYSTTSCSGGAATCKSGPICSTCGITYGAADESAHTGGMATCASGAVCTTCGITYSAADTTQHVWGYTANGAVITATCKNGCNTTATLTLNAPDADALTYNGTAKETTVTGSIDGVTTPAIVYTAAEGSSLTDDKPVNAGNYTASITIEDAGGTQHKASVDFEIEKATPDIDEVSVNELEDTLDVSEVELDRTNKTVAGTLELTDTTLQYGTHTYNWKFTPTGDDAVNYKEITGTVAITVSDTIAPTATYQIGTDGWKQFINTITFGLFCKDYRTVEISYSDGENGSGIATKQYYISNEEITDTSSVAWENYTDTISLNAKGTYFIYVRVADKGGNEVILNSEGIVIYAESTISPAAFDYVYKANTDCTVQITMNGNTFAKLTDGEGNVIATDNYTIDADGKLTLNAAYLDTLDKGEHTYKICMNPQGVETTEVTLAYTFTVNVTAKKLTVTGATATSRDYNNSNTVEITGVTLDGVATDDTVSVVLTGLQGTLSSVNAGTYTSVTLPELTLTGADAENYTLVQPAGAVTTSVEIYKLDAEITVGTDTYSKTFGDEAFTLNVTDTNDEANVQYAVTVGADVVSVSNGTVTILKAGTATITVSIPESTNYNAAVSKTITVNVAKDSYAVDEINKSYLYSRENADSINIRGLLPIDCGTVTYGTPTITGTVTYSVNPSVTDGTLSYTVASGAVNDTGIIIIEVQTQNYETITIIVNIKLIDQIPVNLKEGSSVTLKNNTLTYGESLSKLEFHTAEFVSSDGMLIEGTIAWKESFAVLNAGTASAEWIFTPKSEEYKSCEGTVTVTVNKAVPKVSAAPAVADRVYNPSAALADSDLTGGTVTGVDGSTLTGTWSWQTQGVIPTVENNGFTAVFTPDSTNYETVTETVVVKVTKAVPDIGTVSAGNLSDTIDVENVVLNRTDTSLAGTLELTDSTLKYGTQEYNWKFTPESTNYEELTGTITITVSDTKAPTASYRIGTDGFREFLNKITFGLFFKEYKTVEISYSDEGSGVAVKQYYISNTALEDISNVEWEDYKGTIYLDTENTYFIYVKASDNHGNEFTRNSEGIVIYADSILGTDSAAYIYKQNADLSVQISTNGNTFAKLTDNSGNEVGTDAYTLENGKLTLKAAYLDTLDKGEYTYKIYMNPQGVETTEVELAYSFTITVSARELTVTKAEAESRSYKKDDNTIKITGITLDGIAADDTVSVNLNGVYGTLSSENAGTYTSVTLPELVLDGADKENYILTQPTETVRTNVEIYKQNAEILADVLSYEKTYGDAEFSLGVTDTNAEADVVYTITAGSDVVSVTDGKVSILKAGNAEITISLAESTNYHAADGKTVAITVNKALNAPNMPGSTMNVPNSITSIGAVTLPDGWTWQASDKNTALEVGVAENATAVYTGSDRGNYENESVVITITRSVCEHINTEVRDAKEADCEQTGYTGDTYCKDCGECTETGTEIPLAEHKGGTAACTKKAVCSVCGKEYGSVDSNKHGETEVKGFAEATCTEAGYTGDTHCKDCGVKLSDGTTIPAFGHNYTSEVTKEPTTTEEGVRTYTCSNCKDTYTESIPKLPEEHTHNYTSSVTKEPSCTENGVKTYTCSCGDSYTEPIAKTNHDYTSEVTKEPTTTEEGVRTYTCSACGHTYTKAIDKITDAGSDNNEDNKPDAGKPFIKNEEEKEGWDVIRGEVENAKDGATVTVDMNGATVVPGDVFDDIKGRDVTIVFDMGNGITWSVNGNDITSDHVGDIDFGVKVGADANNIIPVDVINKVTGERYSMNISLSYDGEFGFKAVLSLNLDVKNAGLFANLYYFNESKNVLEFICMDEIAADGTAELVFTHASEYIIVIDKMTEVPDTDGSTENAVPTVPDTDGSAESEIPTSPPTGDTMENIWNGCWLVLTGVLMWIKRKTKSIIK